MDVQLKPLPKKVVFEPIRILVTIQSEKELCDLWLRQNLSGESVDRNNGCYLKYNATQAENEPEATRLWAVLDNLIDELKLRREGF